MPIIATPLPQHPLRLALNDELHARPPVVLPGATWITHLVMLHETSRGRVSASDEETHLKALCDLAQSPFGSQIHGNHWILEAGDLRLKWERHNEFSSYTFFRPRQPGDSARSNALEAFPRDWCASIPGDLLVASHVEYATREQWDPEALVEEINALSDPHVVSRIADGSMLVASDFRLHDGFTHFTVVDDAPGLRQAGGTVQRLIEIETYRMMALLSFPVAREVSQTLSKAEQEAAALMGQIAAAQSLESEHAILARLTRLAADIELSVSQTAFRFGAAEAYYALVRQRIADLREQRVDGHSTIQSFMDRRLAPAMQTCLSVSRRQTELSSRIARNSALLRTRVEMELERQNQELLSQMNRRAKLQLRLQETVEGLSVVAITYYASQLVSYLAKGASHFLPGLDPALVAAGSIPVIAAAVAFGLRRMRKALAAADPHH